jgi:hypothetical protein
VLHVLQERNADCTFLSSWRPKQTSKCPTVQWSGIQNVLEQAESDVLILLDCCHAGTAATSEGNGVTELISACAYNSQANGVGSYSFTKELIIELRELSRRPMFTVAELYKNVFGRIQSRKPEDEDMRERHPAPIHLSLTQDHPRYPRSIQFMRHYVVRQVLSEHQEPIATPTYGASTSNTESEETGKMAHTSSVGESDQENVSKTSEKFDVPRILFAIRLTDSLCAKELSVDLFKEWLRFVPALAEEVKIEAGFGSFSSILIASIPIMLSIYLPKDPSIINIGPITTTNLMSRVQLSTSMPRTFLKDFLMPWHGLTVDIKVFQRIAHRL